MDSLEIDGKEYISARRAGREYGYTSDYIGQLVRKGLIVGKKVGRAWYVEQESLAAYTPAAIGGDHSSLVTHAPERVVETHVEADILPASEKVEDKAESIEEVKNPYESLIVRSLPPEREAQKIAVDDVYSMRYITDDEPTLPRIVERKMEHVAPAESVFVRTQRNETPVEVPKLPEMRYAAPVRLGVSQSNLGRRSLLTLVGALAVAALFIGVVSATFMDKTYTLRGNEITAGVGFSSFGN